MALLVTAEYTTPQGYTVPSVYWRWCGLGIDVTTSTATVQLYGYYSGESFNSGKQPIAQKQVTLTGAEFGSVATQVETPGNDGLSAIIYAKVVEMDGFTGAEVVA